MASRKISDNHLSIGLFYPNASAHWVDVIRIAAKVQNWIYLTDEHSVFTVKSELKKHLFKGEIIANSDWGFRDNVFRFEQVIQKVKEKLSDFLNSDNTEHDWCWSRRFWYRDMHHKLLHNLANIYRQMGNVSEALSYCDKALAIEPCSESAHREKLLSLKAANRLDAVHRQYRLYCESLKKFDMGLPSIEIRDLYLKLVEKG